MLMESENPFLTLRTRGLVLWMIAGTAAFIVLLGAVSAIVHFDAKLSSNLLGVFVYSWMSLWILRKARRNGVDFTRFFRRNSPLRIGRLIGLVLALLIFSGGAIVVYYFTLSHVSPKLLAWLIKPEPPSSSSRVLKVVNLVLNGVISVVLAPVIEELLFRGFLLNRWATKWGIRRAILLSALAFGVLHVDIVGKFAFGVCMALLYLRTGTLWAPMAAHAFHNAVVVAIQFLYGEGGTDSKVRTVDSYRSFPWVGIVFLLVTLPFVLAFIYRNWPGKNQPSPYGQEPPVEAGVVTMPDSVFPEVAGQPPGNP